jgi:hypothetical protein
MHISVTYQKKGKCVYQFKMIHEKTQKASFISDFAKLIYTTVKGCKYKLNYQDYQFPFQICDCPLSLISKKLQRLRQKK